MDCRDFKQVQVATLAGDTTARERKHAMFHARECQPCADDTERDRWLEAAFRLDEQQPGKGFPPARRKLFKELRERRAFYGGVEGPFGPVYLAATERGLCRVSFRGSEERFARELESRGLLPEPDPRRLRRERSEMREYFAGRRQRFALPLDFQLVTPFQRRVLGATARIPFGKVVSYSDIACRIGQPTARRAVGGALGKNPIAIVVPCHRVIAADGSIGGYTGGLHVKRALFQIEGIDLEKKSRR